MDNTMDDFNVHILTNFRNFTPSKFAKNITRVTFGYYK